MDPFQEDLPRQSAPAPGPEALMESTLADTGRTVGPYRLEEEVGRGGMGVVYRARRLDTGELLAVKLMLPEIAANPHFRARFVREASLGSDLDHPNIVPIYDAGDIDGELFIAMRLIAGLDLKELLEQEERLEPKGFLGILRQVASALDAAHEAGVVHHDIKPQNILISGREDEDLVFVTDFGLVKPAGSESTNSRTGSQVFGSIQYMPPEQVEGLPADGRADVYALGCVMFECLTGRIPFDRPNEVAVLWAHVHEDPSRVTDVRPDLPGGLDAVVATAMAKRPEDRFLTCGELVEAFEDGLERSHRPLVMPIVRPLVKRVPRRKTESEVWAPNYFPELARVRKLTDQTNWLQVTAVTAILCLLAAALVHFAHPRGISGAVNDVALAVGESVLSAGKQVTSVFTDEEPASAPARNSSGPRRKRAEAAQLAVSNGARGGGSAPLPVLARPGGEKKGADLLSEPTDRSQEAQAAMRHAILFSAAIPANSCCDYGIYTMRPNGKRVRLLYNTPADELDATWSPDRRRIAFVQGRDIYVMNSDGSAVRQIAVGAGAARHPSWSPDGRQIVFSDRATNGSELFIVNVGGDAIGLPRQVTQSSAGCVSCSSTHPEWAPDGSKIVFSMSSGTSKSLALINPDGSELSLLLTSSEGVASPAWSPDGAHIAYVSGSPGDRRLHVFDTRAERRRSLGCGWHCLAPTWSPDGAKLAFTAGHQRRDLYVLNADGSGSRTRVLPDVEAQTAIDWR